VTGIQFDESDEGVLRNGGDEAAVLHVLNADDVAARQARHGARIARLALVVFACRRCAVIDAVQRIMTHGGHSTDRTATCGCRHHHLVTAVTLCIVVHQLFV